MYVNDLPDVLRGAGLRVEVLPDYATNNHGPLDAVNTILCHHTAGPKTGDRPSLNVVRNGRPGLSGPLSNLFLARSGVWVVVSNGVCWHAGVVGSSRWDNYHAIGIEAEASGVDPWPAAQYDSYVRGVRALRDHYGAEVWGHKEVARPVGRKIDPNFDMNQFRRDVDNVHSAPPVPAPTLGKEYNEMNVDLHFYDKDEDGNFTSNPDGCYFRGRADVEREANVAGYGSAVLSDAYIRWGATDWAPVKGVPAVSWKIVYWDKTKPIAEPDYRLDNHQIPQTARSVTFEGKRASKDVVVSCRLLEKGK